MFDKIFEKTEGAITQLGKALSAFEQESNVLQVKLDHQISGYQTKVTEELANLDAHTKEKVAEKSQEISQLFEVHKKTLVENAEKELNEFSKKVKDRFESIYAEYEVQAVNKAQNAFEADIVNLFKTYGDRIAPYIFKALLKYIFRFGRKST